MLSRKKANEKLFFVTDHKLYENQTAQIVGNDDASEHSGGANSKDNKTNKNSPKQPHMMYDIDMENIQVKSITGSNNSNPQMNGANKHTTASIYHQINKA